MNEENANDINDQIEEAYLKNNPTPENTMEIVMELAEEFGKSANAIRLMLGKRGVYVKKAATKPAPKTTKKEGGAVVNSRGAAKSTVVQQVFNLAESKGVTDLTQEDLGKLTVKQLTFILNLVGG
jgi:hypothetical protein